MIVHNFYGNGKLVLLDYSDTPDGIEKTTKRMELTANGKQLLMVLTMNTGKSSENAPNGPKKEVAISVENLFSLIEAYVEIAY